MLAEDSAIAVERPNPGAGGMAAGVAGAVVAMGDEAEATVVGAERKCKPLGRAPPVRSSAADLNHGLSGHRIDLCEHLRAGCT